MANEEKLTQESKKFIVDVLKEYKLLGTEYQIIVTVGKSRQKLVDKKNKEIYVSVLSDIEATTLKEMHQRIYEEEKDPSDDWRKVLEPHKREKVIEAAIEQFDSEQEEAQNKSENEPKDNKRDLKNGYRKLTDKIYIMSEKTKEKAEKAKEFLREKGKKIGSFLIAIAFAIGVGAYVTDKAIDGYETYQEYGSTTQITEEIKSKITDEYRRALNNENLELDFEIVPATEEEVERLRITTIDKTGENDSISFLTSGYETKNPKYMNKMVRSYLKIKNMSINPGKIGQSRAGAILNEVKRLAEKNDIVIDEDFLGRYDMDRVQPRVIQEDKNTAVEER